MASQELSVEIYIRKIIYSIEMEGNIFRTWSKLKFAAKPNDPMVIKSAEIPI
jgi:hypothetical protein